MWFYEPIFVPKVINIEGTNAFCAFPDAFIENTTRQNTLRIKMLTLDIAI